MSDEARPNEAVNVVGDQLLSVVKRIERLTEEKKALSEDIKEVFSEAKGNGFDTKIIRLVLRARTRDRAELDEEETLFESYWEALNSAAAAAAAKGK